MFRGKNQLDGKWVTQEFSAVEMLGFMKLVSDFNKEAWKESVRAAKELRESDFLTPELEFDAAKAFFDKLGLNTFSVVNNRAQNMR
jgi:hypothetical protein